MYRLRIWDLSLRIFHWAFAVAVLGAIASNMLDWMEIHSYCGYSALVLVVFRCIWGLVGPTHARFSHFIPSASELQAFIKNQQTQRLGHNPLGALSVIAILIVILLQAISGLFVDNEVDFKGPLNRYVSSQMVDYMNQIHASNHWLVYGLVVLHLAAIFYYQRIKKQNLISPMWGGDKLVENDPSKDEQSLASSDQLSTRLLGIGIMLMLAGIFWYFVLR
jgi:cytochrome b